MLENTSTGFIDKGPLPNFAQTDGFGSFSVGDVNNDGWMDIFAAGTVAFVGEARLTKGIYTSIIPGVLQDQPASSFDLSQFVVHPEWWTSTMIKILT